MSKLKATRAQAIDEELWLRAVLRKDTVPLVSITTRTKLEGVDMQALWQEIRDIAIQVDGMGGQRYLKLPHTVWHGRDPAPANEQGWGDTYSSPDAIKAAMARLKLQGDDRIVCQACIHCVGLRCPGGVPIPNMQPNRCKCFTQTTH